MSGDSRKFFAKQAHAGHTPQPFPTLSHGSFSYAVGVMQTMQSAWNALLQRLLSVWHLLLPRLQGAWHWLLQSPYHYRLYVAIAAVLVVLLLMARGLSGRSRGPLVLSLGDSPADELPRRYASFNQTPIPATSNRAITPGWATVTPINRVLPARCTHCQATFTATESFCPTCGYAQPARQSGAAAS